MLSLNKINREARVKIMEIKSISQKIFRTAPNKIDNNGSHTNPFGVNFKGNMITADVFETAAKKVNLIERVSNKSKMHSSAIVGSINDVNQAIKSRIDSVMAIGNRIKEKSVEAWKYLNETKISFSLGKIENSIKLILPERTLSKKSLLKMDPESQIEDMFRLAIATGG